MLLSIILGIVIICLFYVVIKKRNIIILDGERIDKIQNKKIKEGDKCFILKPEETSCKKK